MIERQWLLFLVIGGLLVLWSWTGKISINSLFDDSSPEVLYKQGDDEMTVMSSTKDAEGMIQPKVAHTTSDPQGSWGLTRILDPYRDLVYFTMVKRDQFGELRELVGSIHVWRPLASQNTPIIYIYGWKLSRPQIAELSLWRNVIFQDIQSIFPSVMIEDGRKEGTGTEGNWGTIKDRLISRLAVMHGNVIHVQIGNVFYKNRFSKIKTELSIEGYIRLKSVYGQIILEGYLVDSEPFKCQILAKWDPWNARGCGPGTKKIKLLQGESFGLDEVAQFYDETIPSQSCHICLRNDAHHEWSLQAPHKADAVVIKGKKKTVVLGVASTSRGSNNFWDLPLMSVFLPSLTRSFLGAKELHKAHLIILVGFDEGDQIYDRRGTTERIKEKSHRAFTEQGLSPPQWIFIRMTASHAVTYVWNVLFSYAMNHLRADYFYQLNDDIHFISQGWLSTFPHHLRKQADFGAVGPLDPAFDCRILTQAMVGRPHWRAFGWLFPPHFRNWQCDTWLSLVYASWMKCFNRMPIWNGRYRQDNNTSGSRGLQQAPRYRACKQTEFKPLTLHYQQRLRNQTGVFDPLLFTYDSYENGDDNSDDEDDRRTER